MQALPGGPDESPKIQALSAKIAEAVKEAAALESQIVLRPVRSQYHELRAEINGFLSRSCTLQSFSTMLQKLKVSAPDAIQITFAHSVPLVEVD